jgi:flagellar basal-body rod protein FlgB
MDALSAAMVVKALDGLSVRALVTSQNIANSQTPGYRPLRVSFEQALANAASRGRVAVQGVQPQIQAATSLDGTGVRLDQELATASATALRYSALIDVLGRQLQLHHLAATGSA